MLLVLRRRTPSGGRRGLSEAARRGAVRAPGPPRAGGSRRERTKHPGDRARWPPRPRSGAGGAWTVHRPRGRREVCGSNPSRSCRVRASRSASSDEARVLSSRVIVRGPARALASLRRTVPRTALAPEPRRPRRPTVLASCSPRPAFLVPRAAPRKGAPRAPCPAFPGPASPRPAPAGRCGAESAVPGSSQRP